MDNIAMAIQQSSSRGLEKIRRCTKSLILFLGPNQNKPFKSTVHSQKECKQLAGSNDQRHLPEFNPSDSEMDLRTKKKAYQLIGYWKSMDRLHWNASVPEQRPLGKLKNLGTRKLRSEISE